MRVGFARRFFHRRADEVASQLALLFRRRLAALLRLRRVFSDDFIHQSLNLAGIGHLFQPLFFYDLIGAALAPPHRLEHLFGDLVGQGLIGDPPDQSGQGRRRDGGGARVQAAPVQRGAELAHDPVGDQPRLPTASLHRGLEVIRQGLVGGQ